MKIFFMGDIFGRIGRDAVFKHLPEVKEKLSPDVIIANAENAAHGIGITDKICKELYEAGVDCITSGNHIWDKKEILLYIDKDPKLLRPVNFPAGTAGKGVYEHKLSDGRKIVIINAMGQLFMETLDNPFTAMDEILKDYRLGQNVHAIFVDFHAETTSEKMAMGHYLDGRVSTVVGTHTHIPTADAHIMPGGTAYQTDAGMCGTYHSIIGMDKEEPIRRFVRKMRMEGFKPAQEGEGTLCGIFVETDDKTGKAKIIAPVHLGGLLAKPLPSVETLSKVA